MASRGCSRVGRRGAIHVMGGGRKWRRYRQGTRVHAGASSRVSYLRVSNLAPCHSRTTQTPEGAKPLCDGSLAAPLAQRGGRNSPINRATRVSSQSLAFLSKKLTSPRAHVPHTFDSRRREPRAARPRVMFRAWGTVAARLAGRFVSRGKPSRRNIRYLSVSFGGWWLKKAVPEMAPAAEGGEG